MQQPEHKIESDPVSRSIVSKSQSIAQSPTHTTVPELENRQPKEPSPKEPEIPKPGIQVSKSNYQRRGLVVGVAVAAAARETLRQMDREL